MISPGTIRTVLGDLDVASAAGLHWDYHEHLFQASRLLPGEDIDDPDRSRDEAALLTAAGITAMVEATPIGLGRRPDAVAAISAATGLTVVHVTGAHRAEHYADDHPILGNSVAMLANTFVQEIERGMPAVDSDGSTRLALGPSQPVRAGMVKIGIGYWRISSFERRVLTAAGAAHRRTGVSVMVHLEHGSAAHEVLDLLEVEGVAAPRVVLAHVDRNLDSGLHIELAQRGAHLGYDGMARHQNAPDSAIVDCLAAVVEAGHGDRILLGGDVARRSRYISYGGMPGLSYLAARFLPRLVARLGRDAVEKAVRVNPLRLLTLGVDPTPCNSPSRSHSSLTAEARIPSQSSSSPPNPAIPSPIELQGQRLIAIATVDAVEHADPLGHCLLEAGLRSIEITFRTDDAPAVLQRIREATDLTVGAGTVLTPSQVDRAVDAGAQFIVTPGFSRAVIERCFELSCPVVPGVATASDVMAAFDAGVRVLKFFPAEALGGLRTLDALTGPFPQARFVPTGGVTLESAPRYLCHTSVLAVGGSWMVAPNLLHAARWDEITRLCREAVGATTLATAAAPDLPM